MKLPYRFIPILLLGGAEASPALDEPWIAYVNSQMLNASNPSSGVEAAAPGSRDLTIEANGGRFWIGKAPSAYCPAGVDKLDCSAYKGNQTIFVGANDFGDGAVSLNVAVPGGQQVYVAPDGTLGYTPPHSASMPQGSEVAIFGRAPLTAGASGQLVLWTSAGDFEACPSTESDVYQIFVRVQDSQREDCTLVFVRTRSTNGTSSWQYT